MPLHTSALISCLGLPADAPQLEQSLRALRIYERPKTVAQLEEEEFIEDDGETDIEYELLQESKASMIVESERYGFCMIFKNREDYSLVHADVHPGDSPFVLSEIAFYAQGVQIYQQYAGVLPGGVEFGVKQDELFLKLGHPLGLRSVYEAPVALFLLDNQITNYGFDLEGALVQVHVRKRNVFDGVMLAPKFDLPHVSVADMLAGNLIGLLSSAPEVREFLISRGVDDDDAYPGACPEEITHFTRQLGLTIYFSDSNLGQRVSSVTYKRRGDLGSQGYGGLLPMGFEFGDSPSCLVKKAGRLPVARFEDDQLESLFWYIESGFLIQAVCSLIDWQLARLVVHAPFSADRVLNG